MSQSINNSEPTLSERVRLQAGESRHDAINQDFMRRLLDAIPLRSQNQTPDQKPKAEEGRTP